MDRYVREIHNGENPRDHWRILWQLAGIPRAEHRPIERTMIGEKKKQIEQDIEIRFPIVTFKLEAMSCRRGGRNSPNY